MQEILPCFSYKLKDVSSTARRETALGSTSAEGKCSRKPTNFQRTEMTQLNERVLDDQVVSNGPGEDGLDGGDGVLDRGGALRLEQCPFDSGQVELLQLADTKLGADDPQGRPGAAGSGSFGE